MNEASVIALITQFVERTRGKQSKPITGDTRLLREGLIDSFQLVELIADLEKASKLTLADGTLIPDDFETPKILAERLAELS